MMFRLALKITTLYSFNVKNLSLECRTVYNVVCSFILPHRRSGICYLDKVYDVAYIQYKQIVHCHIREN